ncbi:MAG TPA: hypothetical protein VF692_12060 [Pyrinomonadaceae bacterium]|jgi:hypothetical protein
MSEETKVETNVETETPVNHTKENLQSVGQMIVGELETIGGILTGDPLTRAEGEFNLETGSLHQNVNKNLTAIDEREESETN